MFDDIPRRRLHARQHVLGERLDAIAELDPDALTPREALDALYALKRLVAEG